MLCPPRSHFHCTYASPHQAWWCDWHCADRRNTLEDVFKSLQHLWCVRCIADDLRTLGILLESLSNCTYGLGMQSELQELAVIVSNAIRRTHSPLCTFCTPTSLVYALCLNGVSSQGLGHWCSTALHHEARFVHQSLFVHIFNAVTTNMPAASPGHFRHMYQGTIPNQVSGGVLVQACAPQMAKLRQHEDQRIRHQTKGRFPFILMMYIFHFACTHLLYFKAVSTFQ